MRQGEVGAIRWLWGRTGFNPARCCGRAMIWFFEEALDVLLQLGGVIKRFLRCPSRLWGRPSSIYVRSKKKMVYIIIIDYRNLKNRNVVT